MRLLDLRYAKKANHENDGINGSCDVETPAPTDRIGEYTTKGQSDGETNRLATAHCSERDVPTLTLWKRTGDDAHR